MKYPFCLFEQGTNFCGFDSKIQSFPDYTRLGANLKLNFSDHRSICFFSIFFSYFNDTHDD